MGKAVLCKKKLYLRISLVISIYLAIYFCITMFNFPKVGVVMDKTGSLPYKFYISYSGQFHLKKGDIVLLRNPNISVPLIKKIAGFAGERVELNENNEISVGKLRIGKVLTRTLLDGTQIRPLQEKTIPEGFVFVFGTHPESFDSRYNEFGLIPQENIRQLLWPVF